MINDLIHPPVAFTQVYKGIYRCSHPLKSTYSFLLLLNIQVIICCDGCEITNNFKEFCNINSIKIIEKNVGYNQEPFVVMNDNIIREIITILLDSNNHPILIFCSNGKIITSTVIACLRRALNWSVVSTMDEFEKFAGGEWDMHDIQFIENFTY